MHLIRVCTGCSCEKNFGAETLKKAETLLKIKAGESTPDGRFKLEKTGCLGFCQEAPAVLIQKQTGPLSMIMQDKMEVKTKMLPHRFEKELQLLLESDSPSN